MRFVVTYNRWSIPPSTPEYIIIDARPQSCTAPVLGRAKKQSMESIDAHCVQRNPKRIAEQRQSVCNTQIWQAPPKHNLYREMCDCIERFPNILQGQCWLKPVSSHQAQCCQIAHQYYPTWPSLGFFLYSKEFFTIRCCPRDKTTRISALQHSASYVSGVANGKTD